MLPYLSPPEYGCTAVLYMTVRLIAADFKNRAVFMGLLTDAFVSRTVPNTALG